MTACSSVSFADWYSHGRRIESAASIWTPEIVRKHRSLSPREESRSGSAPQPGRGVRRALPGPPLRVVSGSLHPAHNGLVRRAATTGMPPAVANARSTASVPPPTRDDVLRHQWFDSLDQVVGRVRHAQPNRMTFNTPTT
jgi:hypothetical protein